MSAGTANYLNAGHTIKSWLLTTDHKRIGILYLFSILFSLPSQFVRQR